MLTSTSSEFVALCRTQTALLTQGLGASLAVVYLTEELSEALDSKLTPLVAYPEAASDWTLDDMLAWLSQGMNTSPVAMPRLIANPTEPQTEENPDTYRPSRIPPALPGANPLVPLHEPIASEDDRGAFIEQSMPQQQVVLPLMYEGMMMGLLVTVRTDRPWLEPERNQIERVAQTLAIAMVLDQRGQWLDHDLRQQRLLQAQQHDVFDDLLHQFRNPLTALRTFGKLLLRRLLLGDPNREVASGIVRESDRLQELLKQFDAAIDMGDSSWLSQGQSGGRAGADWETQMEAELRTRLHDQSSRQPNPRLLPATPTTGDLAAFLLPGTHYLTGTPLQLEAYSLADVLDPLLPSAEAIAQDRQLTLFVTLPPDLPPLRADLKALREVLNNLIDNALKYTPAGGTVSIQGIRQASDQEPRQGLLIADTGPGIPPEDQEHLFERHYRGVQANTDIPGSGLGLAIARDLVHQMQGEIQVCSPVQSCPWLDLGTDELVRDGQAGTAFIVWLSEAKG